MLSGNSKVWKALVAGLLLTLSVPFSLAQGRHAGNRGGTQAPRHPAQTQQERRSGHHAGAWLREHRNLPPDQQQRALENDPQFRKLPPQRQQELRERLQRFNSLPPEQQDRILKRMDTWEHLTPEQRQQARDLAQQMRQLPPDRRKMMQTAIRDLRQMPPEQRQQVLDSPRFKSMFSPQEHEILKGITQLPLAPTEASEEGGEAK